MEQKKGAGRIAKWDNARWILITLVVICHFFENYLGNPVANSLFFYVYTFHMPAFFLLRIITEGVISGLILCVIVCRYPETAAHADR